MLSEDASPDALQGSFTVVALLFFGYTLLSVLGIVMVKRWLPEAGASISSGHMSAAPVWWSALGAFAYVLSFLLWMILVTRAPLSVAYPVAVGATMCLTLVAGFWVFKERPTTVQLLGSALVLAGIFLIGSGLRR